VTLPASATECHTALLLLGDRRSPLLIDISCPHSTQQQTCCMLYLQSDRQRD